MDLTDDQLYMASAQARELFLNALPSYKECDHQFSGRFGRKMRPLLTSLRYRPVHIAMQRVAAVILATVLLAGSWLTLDTNARAAFLRWAREWYEDHIAYRFAGDADTKELPRYGISSLPTGYEETETQFSPDESNIIYQNKAGNRIYFFCDIMESGKLTSINTADMTVSRIKVNQYSGELYLSQIQTQSSSIIWMDDKAGISFVIDAYANKQELIRMAESVVQIDKAK